jgi:2-polyprenyl-6-hydroxyphenyl methylase/3-demethylubiquinone-9 3-methyltransferase
VAYVRARAPLAGQRVLDLGCGGGLLAEALAAEGARVVGLDLAAELIEVARLHALESGAQVEYRHTSAEQLALAEPASFDVICCMEMLEHVPDPAQVLQAASHMLKPGGHLFLSTLNRTPRAFLGAIVGAEYLLRLLPRGTHQYERFIRPAELGSWLRAADCELLDVQGIHYVPPLRRAFLGGSPAVNYLAWARRNPA